MKRFLLLLSLAFFTVTGIYGGHFLGGEITWECTSVGHYRFTLVLYRECHGASLPHPTFPGQVLMRSNAPGFHHTILHRVASEEITPQCGCPGGISYSCGDSLGQPGTGSMERMVYTSDISYPNGLPLTGTPPESGWWFGYGDCCRAENSNITFPANTTFLVRAYMFPYKGRDVKLCYDNSPVFAEIPAPVFCAGQPSTYLPFGYDPDGDSLAYDWVHSLYNHITHAIQSYQPGYSFDSPLPNLQHDSLNVPATMHPQTGEVSFTSHTTGSFATVTRISSYKNGIRTAAVYREIPFIILDCDQNTPPTVNTDLQYTPGSTSQYRAAVTAGDSVSIGIWASDPDLCHNTTVNQEMLLYAHSPQFGNLLTDTVCATPPCATIYPSQGAASPLIMTQHHFTHLTWQTSSQHLSLRDGLFETTTYSFFLYVLDNHCPVPGMRQIEIVLDVIPSATNRAPEVVCLKVLPGGDVDIRWETFDTAAGPFGGYRLMGSTMAAGPYINLYNSSHLTDTTFQHQGVNSKMTPLHYYLLVDHQNQPVNPATPAGVASTIHLSVQPLTATGLVNQLSWNPTHPYNQFWFNPVFEIYRSTDAVHWDVIGATMQHHFTDTIQPINSHPAIYYKIEQLTVLHGIALECRSISNVAVAQIVDTDIPDSHTANFTLYPNPAGDFITLIPHHLTGKFTIEIFSLTGQRLNIRQYTINHNEAITLDISSLSPGIYMVHLAGETYLKTHKLVVQ